MVSSIEKVSVIAMTLQATCIRFVFNCFRLGERDAFVCVVYWLCTPEGYNASYHIESVAKQAFYEVVSFK